MNDDEITPGERARIDQSRAAMAEATRTLGASLWELFQEVYGKELGDVDLVALGPQFDAATAAMQQAAGRMIERHPRQAAHLMAWLAGQELTRMAVLDRLGRLAP